VSSINLTLNESENKRASSIFAKIESPRIFLIRPHGQSQSHTVCPVFCSLPPGIFMSGLEKNQSYMCHLFNEHHDRLIMFLLFVRSQHLIARKMFVSSLATGSHPSWSSLLQFNLFLVHFYGVLDSIQFRC